MNRVKSVLLNKKKGKLTGVVAGVVVFLIVLLTLNFFSAEVRNFFLNTASPIEKLMWQTAEPISKYFSFVLNLGNLEQENSELKKENQKLLSQIVFLQSVAKISELESAARAVLQKNNFNYVMAGIVGFDNNGEITLNKGSADGVFENMPVVNEQGVLYGKIITSYKNFSYVQLISSQSSVVSVKALQESQETTENAVEGVVKGTGGLDLILDLVPVDENLKEGSVLISSALDGTFPKGLLVGKIEKVQKNDQLPHQQAKVSPFFNVSVDCLFIITNYKRIE